MPLGEVTDVDAAASVVAADVWMRVLGVSSLTGPGHDHAADVAAVLHAVLLRASGRGRPASGQVRLSGLPLPSDVAGLEVYRRASQLMLPGGGAGRALLAAAHDLQLGGASDAGAMLAGYGAALFLLDV